MSKKSSLLLGKLYTIDFPEDFPITYYPCEKKYKTIEDMQYHNHYEFGLCLDGQGIFLIGNKMIPFTQGNISFIPPGVPHFVQSLDAHPSHWLFIALSDEILSSPPPEVSENVIFDSCMEQVFQLITEELSKQSEGYQTVVSNLCEVLFIRAARLKNDAPVFFNYNNALSSVYPAIEYIAGHYSEDIEIIHLANLCNMSLTHFRRKFTAVTNMTPLKYLLTMRLRMACVLLRLTDKKVSDISFEVGYNTLSSFNRHFKENYKMSPKDYRVKIKNFS
ncbi:MAG: helix-turn-helix transcriptional regulator [Oscillospiraceae bacterium]|nr:helix-turn-helix transcriptional regulator [Oscillospiraceae bacterium]MBQ7119123.1 helix-turn-helix transcriptional regulator [Oscillospiraceae bacterium]